MDDPRKLAHKGRGALNNIAGRYELQQSSLIDDGWDNLEHDSPTQKTELNIDNSRSVIVTNNSPDLHFHQSINPYRGCEHGCVYCYARPSHAYLGLSPGLDFEQQIFYKPEAAKLLRQELAKPSYQCRIIGLGTNTDPYQPVERKQRVMRDILQVLHDTHHPVSITTKGNLIIRDLDLLAEMATDNLIEVAISVTTLNTDLARILEPRASAPHSRLKTIEQLAKKGVPVHVSVSPIIPSLNDDELEDILAAAAAVGATTASWILIRLPHEVKDMFVEWLQEHYADRADKIMNRIREARGGKENDSRFHHRFRGQGHYVSMIKQRFKLAVKRLGLNQRKHELNTTSFVKPITKVDHQIALF